MNLNKSTFLRFLLDALYVAGAHRISVASCHGVGVILTLHHVRPATAVEPFAPNRILSITPEFLDQTIRQIGELGYEFVTLDQVKKKLLDGDFSRKFVCFTLDDGYIDNFEYAVPIFDKHETPYTVYVSTGMPDGTLVQWWQHLEDIVRDQEEIRVTIADREFHYEIRTTAEKHRAFDAIYWSMRGAPHAIQQSAIQELLSRYAVDAADLCAQSAMPWSMLKEISRADNCTIGAHTVNHFALKKLPYEEVRREADQSRQILAQRLDKSPEHFSYPYGAPDSAGSREFEIIKDLGFATATTTRKGVLFPEHRKYLHALPRISLNGDYQRQRYVSLFLSGVPFALANRFRRIDVQ